MQALTSNVVMHPREQLRQMRAKIAEAAQRLIDLLDQIDGDPDLEDGGDSEPSLGSLAQIHQGNWSASAWGSDIGATDDLEEQCDDDGIDTDSEPNADDQDSTWLVTPFAVDQSGAGWA